MSYYIGVDVGGTNVVVGLVKNKKIKDKISIETNKTKKIEYIVNDIVVLVNKILYKNNITLNQIKSIGVGLPGCINSVDGVIEFYSTFNIIDFKFKNFLSEKLGYNNIYIENDANAAAYGEYISYSHNINSLLMVTLGTGVGGGFIVNNKVYNGINGAALEIGHMSININGKKCSCGNYGCFEQYASATALVNLAKENILSCDDNSLGCLTKDSLDNLNGEKILDAYNNNDDLAILIINEYTRYLGLGLVNLVNILNPDTIAIGGGISNFGNVILDNISHYLDNYEYSKHLNKRCKIIISRLKNDAGIIGAALLEKQSF
ncbi:MAG: ROK family protein [Oscillospiraceae bacterium]